MKCHIPQISWHNRDPILSIDFQTCQENIRRLATAGTDSHILIWLVSLNSDGSVSLEFASDLSRHSKPVNVVRFSPNGEMLASGDDEASVIIWKQQEREIGESSNDEENENKEHWLPLKMLRGHLDDICDLCWSADNNFLISGSVDNSSILWDVQKGKKTNVLTESKGFVQGVTWDPQNQYLATLSSDRTLRVYNLSSKRVIHKVYKAIIPSSTASTDQENVTNKPTKIFYDDTLKSFSRRLTFSPDGELLIAPSGIIEQEDGQILNTVYVFTRFSLNKPVMYLPSGAKYTLAVRCCPVLFELRKTSTDSRENNDENKESLDSKANKDAESVFSLPYRIVFAVATQDSVLLYDSQQTIPFAHVGNIHYTHLSDLAWSPDGRILMASSTDGYCSFIIFNEGEIGKPYTGEIPKKETSSKTPPVQQSKKCSPRHPTSTPTESPKSSSAGSKELSSDLKTTPARKKKVSQKLNSSPSEVSKNEGSFVSIESPKSSKVSNTDVASTVTEMMQNLTNNEQTLTPKNEINLDEPKIEKCVSSESNSDITFLKPQTPKPEVKKQGRRIQLVTLSKSCSTNQKS